ncbi:PLDc N-terminal domain-containing protein [Cellulomonas hominis]|jgi:hypothetical protein|uniref:Cardiolipin synthase N-terminal domain-containing protein n=1 Tax=Cellulomonas hominis TaxID=156981 RepID=A0A511F8W7_9CELL|nr:PLDc N-terminal domain-containing protein [Cellulomonas hominis]MBB5472392.1 hypothetical protein [Cellulomonas hominis]MBU5421985.1 PLDc N-terminal domain-containing protein [Cellulomonas hominis]NKY10488.1 hypothetical protein [Cellulomonas hominis]GEL45670.1 hypothetical protein CHO01_07860 [Cellulomonas hominis]
MPRALFILVTIGLAVYAIADIASSDDDDRLGVPRLPWFVVALVPIVGPVAWIVVSRAQRARRAGGGTSAPGPAAPPRPPRRRGPVAPDDDPEFLWRLDQERIRRERETGGSAGETPGDDEPHRTDGDVPDDGARG